MNWMFKFFQNNLLEQLKTKYIAASKESAVLRKQFNRPNNITSYYDQAENDYQVDSYAIKPWVELLQWINSVISMVPVNELSLFQEAKQEIETRVSNLKQPNEADFDGYLDEDIIKFYLDLNSEQGFRTLIDLLNKNKIPSETVKSPTGKKIFVFEYITLWVVEVDNNELTYWSDSNEWIEYAADHSYLYFPEVDFSKEFWEGIGTGSYLYHATDEENVESIMKQGLLASSKTRGLRNRGMGDAVFGITGENSDNIEGALGAYGTSIIQIDLGMMKADNYMPDAEKETPINECEIKESLAHLIGDENYYAECDGDYMNDTIAIYGNIPPKYLKVL